MSGAQRINYDEWSVKDIEYLINEYEWTDKKILINKLRRSWGSIQAKASKLSLLRSNRLGKVIKIGDYNFNYMINSCGYMLISNPRLKIRSMLAHRYVWEAEVGDIPLGYHIHHKDGNKCNNNLTNLELVNNDIHWVHGAINQVAKKCFDISDEHGFWDRDINNKPTRDISEALMLIITEVSEAYEAYRIGNITENSKDNFTEELADVLIRLLDLSYGFDLHIENAMMKKMKINKKRPYKHGKNF